MNIVQLVVCALYRCFHPTIKILGSLDDAAHSNGTIAGISKVDNVSQTHIRQISDMYQLSTRNPGVGDQTHY